MVRYVGDEIYQISFKKPRDGYNRMLEKEKKVAA
jgi:hypothetical protein